MVIIHKLSHNYSYAQYLNEIRLKSAFMTLCIKNMWKKRCKRVAGYTDTFEQMKRKRLRNVFVFACNSINPDYEERGLKTLRGFLKDWSANLKMKTQFQDFFKKIIFMQKKIKSQRVIRDAKVDVLINYWDILIRKIQTKAVKTKDKTTQALCENIILIEKSVQR